jgi:hypothetical protein
MELFTNSIDNYTRVFTLDWIKGWMSPEKRIILFCLLINTVFIKLGLVLVKIKTAMTAPVVAPSARPEGAVSKS